MFDRVFSLHKLISKTKKLLSTDNTWKITTKIYLSFDFQWTVSVYGKVVLKHRKIGCNIKRQKDIKT